MDTTAIVIIVISVVLALTFKIYLYRRIQKWIDQDLIKGLAEGNSEKHSYLLEQYQLLSAEKVKRKLLHEKLIELAEQFEPSSH